MKHISFNFDSSRVTASEIAERSTSLESYRSKLKTVVETKDYTSLEASLVVPYDETLLAQVKSVLETKDISQLKYIFVVGIGGSNLGTKAVYDAIRGLDDGHRKSGPKMIFLDTVGQKLFEIMRDIIEESVMDLDEILINVISKSGGTAETIFNAEVLIDMIKTKLPTGIEDRVVVTTNKDSALQLAAEKASMDYLTIPELVGGRYSVLTGVGLFPLLAVGLDVEKLLSGAQDMLSDCLEKENNPAMMSAVVSHSLLSQGIVINNTFVFNPELESAGKWYRQLMGESVGKRNNLEGVEVRTGIVPMVSVGSTDLHSMAQLYFGGPRNILHGFISSLPTREDFMPQDRTYDSLIEDIEGKSNKNLMEAILGGTQATLVNNEVPFIDISIDEINEYTLGAYLQFRMTEMMYLAQLMNVNAFDQPSVEEYKIETKRILSQIN